MFTVDQIIIFLKRCESQGMTLNDCIQVLEYTGSEQIPQTVQDPQDVPSQPVTV